MHTIKKSLFILMILSCNLIVQSMDDTTARLREVARPKSTCFNNVLKLMGAGLVVAIITISCKTLPQGSASSNPAGISICEQPTSDMTGQCWSIMSCESGCAKSAGALVHCPIEGSVVAKDLLAGSNDAQELCVKKEPCAKNPDCAPKGNASKPASNKNFKSLASRKRGQ